jgi:hypothetical protein
MTVSTLRPNRTTPNTMDESVRGPAPTRLGQVFATTFNFEGRMGPPGCRTSPEISARERPSVLPLTAWLEKTTTRKIAVAGA